MLVVISSVTYKISSYVDLIPLCFEILSLIFHFFKEILKNRDGFQYKSNYVTVLLLSSIFILL